MKKSNSIVLFNQKQVRRFYNEKKETWYFSIIDVIEALTKTDRPRKYWNDLKTKLKNEGSELSEKIGQLKMRASDGKFYLTDVADRSVKDYKKFKGLKKENLRDNMTNLELVLNMLAEASTTEISKKKKPKGLENNKQIARAGGIAARKARLEIEKQTGESVITAKSAKLLKGKQNPSLADKRKI